MLSAPLLVALAEVPSPLDVPAVLLFGVCAALSRPLSRASSCVVVSSMTTSSSSVETVWVMAVLSAFVCVEGAVACGDGVP